jgi:RNA polymerase sigma factor (TIGR02999 family)
VGGRTPTNTTELLLAWRGGDRAASDELLTHLYQELRRLARSQLARERGDHTLQPTALVHEAYLRLVEVERVEWQSRAHFLSMAARTMRRVLVDHARKRGAAKREAGRRITLEPELAVTPAPDVEVLELDRALQALAEVDPERAQIVEMRFFAGLTIEEIAGVLELSPRTVKRRWRASRAWLYEALSGAPLPASDRADDTD